MTLSRQDLSDTKSNNVNNDTLVLMQMPACVSANDVKGARIVATPSQQACLVLQDKAQTYSMSRVETSNAYIMAPPPTPTTTDQRPRKKTKRDTTLVSVPVRLLQPGGSGASFIELKRKNLQLADLQEQLKEHVLYPFDESKRWTGRTLSSLAVDLQCSEREVLNGLKRIQALGITTESNDGTKNTTYGILSEEALQECKISIVATLMECDEFQDYAGTGISKATCVEQVMSRVPAGEQYTDMDQVIQHTLRTLQKNDNDDDGATNDDAKIQLDVNKVRIRILLTTVLLATSLTPSLSTWIRLPLVSFTACLPNSQSRGKNKSSWPNGSARRPESEKSIKFPWKCYAVWRCSVPPTRINTSSFPKKSCRRI